MIPPLVSLLERLPKKRLSSVAPRPRSRSVWFTSGGTSCGEGIEHRPIGSALAVRHHRVFDPFLNPPESPEQTWFGNDQSPHVSWTIFRTAETLTRRLPSHGHACTGSARSTGETMPYPTMVVRTFSDRASVPAAASAAGSMPDGARSRITWTNLLVGIHRGRGGSSAPYGPTPRPEREW